MVRLAALRARRSGQASHEDLILSLSKHEMIRGRLPL
jgi:hypothetical protein